MTRQLVADPAIASNIRSACWSFDPLAIEIDGRFGAFVSLLMILGLCRAGMLGLLLVWIRAVDEPGRMIAPCFNFNSSKAGALSRDPSDP